MPRFAIASASLCLGLGLCSSPDLARQAERCPAAATALLSSALEATMRGAFVSLDVYYDSGADTLGLGELDFNRRTRWLTTDAGTRCLDNSSTRARFELTWPVVAGLWGSPLAPSVRPSHGTMTDTLLLSHRRILTDLSFLLVKVGLEGALEFPVAAPDRDEVASLAWPASRPPRTAPSEATCPDAARAILDSALSAGLRGAFTSTANFHETGADTLGFNRTEAWGDYSWVVSGITLRCLGSSGDDARFEIQWNLSGRLSGSRYEPDSQAATDTVVVRRRWVIDDLDPLSTRLGPAAIESLDVSAAVKHQLDSLVARYRSGP
jgi:hypothetical protein